MNEGGDIAAQIEQRMELHGRLGGSERCPREYGQAQIDGRGIQRIDGVVELDRQRVIGIKPPRDADQVLGEVGIDAPVAHGVGIGQRVAGDVAAETQMVELGRLRTKASFNIAQALAPGQLRERQAQILIKAREPLDLVLAIVAGHATTKRRQRQMLHELGKDVMALMHRATPRRVGTLLNAYK